MGSGGATTVPDDERNKAVGRSNLELAIQKFTNTRHQVPRVLTPGGSGSNF